MMALKKSKRGLAKQRSENTSPQRKRAPSEERERNRYEKVKALSEKFKLTNKQIYELEAEYNSLLEISKQGTENEFDFLKDKPSKPSKKVSTSNVKMSEKENSLENLPLKVYLR